MTTDVKKRSNKNFKNVKIRKNVTKILKKVCKRNKKRYFFLVQFNSTSDAQEMAFKAIMPFSFAETVVVLC